MLHPTVFNTSEICYAYGVRHAVLSPGSRNAPLSISFARNSKIKKWIIPDERSASFIALGIAQKSKEPVVLCCTSGTALLNYYPAIAEAYYREIPLIVLSADRPEDLIDQRDGQTIRQFQVLKNHVKASFQLPLITNDNLAEEYEEKLINGLQILSDLPGRPVHLNIPFQEPFYPKAGQALNFKSIETKLSSIKEEAFGSNSIDFEGKKVLILIGQMTNEPQLDRALAHLSDQVPIIKSPLSNVMANGIDHVDLFIQDQEELKPEILITSGLSVLSKKLKNYLRTCKPDLHFHLDPAGVKVDTFQTNPQLLKLDLATFLSQSDLSAADTDYVLKWKNHSDTTKRSIDEYIRKADFSECTASYSVLNALPNSIDLHVSNSMPVRYLDIFGTGDLTVWSNRGTSGIDGCTSTAYGTSLVSKNLNVLLTGDLAFLYDRNAFFHNYTATNLRVIVFNNQGGGIFRLIDGPSKLPELEEYFETRHNRTAEYICLENKIAYHTASDEVELKEKLNDFFEPSSQPKLLEIFTDPIINEHVFKNLKKHIHEQLQN